MYQSLFRLGFFFFLSFVSIGLSGCDTPSQQAPAVPIELGAAAPDFSLQDLSGKTVSLSDYQGKVVLLNFWATWCPPCKAEMHSLESLYRQLSGEGLVILAVNIEQNGAQTVKAFLKESPHSFPILLDDQAKIQKLYGVYQFPETFVIRKDGTIDDRVIGAIDWVHPDAVEYFKLLLKGPE